MLMMNNNIGLNKSIRLKNNIKSIDFLRLF